MEELGWLLLAIVVAYGSAAVVPFVRRWGRVRFGRLAIWCVALGVLACPLLIPSTLVVYRAASAFVSADLTFKIIDYFRLCGRERRDVSLREYYWVLLPFPVLSIVYPDHKRRLSRRENPWPHVLRIVAGSVGIAAGFGLLHLFSRVPLVRSSFAVEHVAMLLAFVLTIESISRILFGLERLAGFDTTPIIRNAFLSRTVAEFRMRYNSRVHDWFVQNLFRAGGVRRKPVRALWLVFLVSALFHELMFDIATSTIDGTQFAFFLLQAPASMASGRLERLTKRGGLAGKVVSHGFTILFLSATSVLFFHGVRRVFPFIYSENGT